MQSPAISTGDWIGISLIIFFGLVSIVGVVIAWKMLRRPPTTITPGFWKVERFSSETVSRLLQVSGVVVFSPMGTSFKVSDTKCEISSGGERVPLLPIQDHRKDLHQGGLSLQFVFREEGPESAFPDDPSLVVDVDVWIKLADGSKLHDPPRNLRTGDQTIQVNVALLRIDRSPTEAAIFVFNKHMRNPVKRRIAAVWKYLRHGL